MDSGFLNAPPTPKSQSPQRSNPSGQDWPPPASSVHPAWASPAARGRACHGVPQLAHGRQDARSSARRRTWLWVSAGPRVEGGEDVCPAKAGARGLVGRQRDVVRSHTGRQEPAPPGHHRDCSVCQTPVSFGGAASWWLAPGANVKVRTSGDLTGIGRGA